MRPLSTRIFELDATYDEIIKNIDVHEELKKMKEVVETHNVIYII
jgi:hypothetical protein